MATSQPFTVTLQCADGVDVHFPASSQQTIVRAAARAGYQLTTGCLQGRCAICRARLVSGQVRSVRRYSKHAITSPVDRPDGCVLLCSVAPASNVVVAPLSPWDTIVTVEPPQRG